MFDNDGPEDNSPIGNDSGPEENEPLIDLTNPFDGNLLGVDWTPLVEVDGWNESDVEELEEGVGEDDKFSCGHDEDKRQFVVVPRSGGVNIMGNGLQTGGGVLMHGCTVCGEIHEVPRNQIDRQGLF